MNNKEIRELIAKRRLKYFEVAKALGVSTYTFSHWLQNELPPQKKKEILEVIKNIEI